MIDIVMTEGSIGPQKIEELVENLSTALINGEGAPDNEYTRSVTWCFVDQRPKNAICVGGRPPEKPRYRITLTVPIGAPRIYGPLMKAARQALIAETTKLVLDAEGADHSFDNLSRVWVHIREISEGYWGAFGDIAEMNDIATFVMGEPAIGHKTDRATRWRTEFDSIGAQD
jgi:phenylpyruvate tautomerase PptA (4-oxalocrotonate tautomerase family)